jgi:hypothetical protein
MKPDLVTSLYLGFVILCGIVYTCFGLTPSSYGVVLAQIGAPEQGPILGTARSIRADEWASATPYFQAAVRNGFRRVNESSFYREDLRGVYLLPLKDWSLIFKPELWAFFIVSPATAFSFYYALLMCGFLAGYFLLFRQMELDPFVSAAAATILYFTGFTQFFWTTFAPLTAGLPWILLILFARLRCWLKALLFSWTMPVLVLSYVYPTFFTEFALAGIVLILVLRPALFRSPRELAALAIGGLATATVFCVYYQDLIPVMRNTWYPGKRISGPGTMPITAALSQFFPFLSFTLRGYRNLVGSNICEIGAVGSFLPLLTLCLMSPIPQSDRSLRRGLIVILAALALIAGWQLAPMPQWVGHILLWDHGDPQRLLFVSGLLITVGSLLIWRQKLVQPDPRRIALFVAAGPVLSLVLKVACFHLGLPELTADFALCGLGLAAGAVACMIPTAARLSLLLGAIALMNVLAFGRFNPLQPAGPIFQVPETDLVLRFRQAEASTPGRLLLEPRFFGATLNGMGFRSVNHALPAPSLSVFRQYFPAMDARQFDFVFNRYAYIHLTNDALPRVRNTIFVDVPAQAFEPVRNIRTVALDVRAHKDCSIQRGGAIERVSAQGDWVALEGWAPWKGEEAVQELRVSSARTLRAGALLTVRRPDISESKKDYAYTRSGFKLDLSSSDGRPIQPEEIVLVAHGTSQGLAQLSGCGCP